MKSTLGYKSFAKHPVTTSRTCAHTINFVQQSIDGLVCVPTIYYFNAIGISTLLHDDKG